MKKKSSKLSVELNPGVAGGTACIVRTRIPVWLLEQARLSGATDADLLQAYPSLRAEDLTNARAYARSHADEIAKSVTDNDL